MMHLSRLTLNPRCRQVRAELRNPYEMHRTLLKAFGARREDAGVLYRVDVDRRTGLPTVLVQSHREPDWTCLRAVDDYLLAEGDDNPAVKPIDPGFSAGQLLQFRLRANPTKKLTKNRTGKENGTRVGLYQEEEQLCWLRRKLADAGCGVLTCQVVKEDLVEAGKRDEGGKPVKMPLLPVRFEGVLQVTQPELLQQAVQQGIGSAKAFGFGLLSLAPAR